MLGSVFPLRTRRRPRPRYLTAFEQRLFAPTKKLQIISRTRYLTRCLTRRLTYESHFERND